MGREGRREKRRRVEVLQDGIVTADFIECVSDDEVFREGK